MIALNEFDRIVSEGALHRLEVRGYKDEESCFADFIVTGHGGAAMCDRVDAEAIRDWLIEYLQ